MVLQKIIVNFVIDISFYIRGTYKDMSNRKVKMSDIIDFLIANGSELSKLSDDDNDNEIEVPKNVLVSMAVSSDEENEDEDDVHLATLQIAVAAVI